MVYVIVLILLLLAALFVLLRYERYAHRSYKQPSYFVKKKDKEGNFVKDENGEVVLIPAGYGALDESLFTGIKHGLAEDWRRLRHRGRPDG